VILNFSQEDKSFIIPEEKWGKKWKKIIDTTATSGFVEDDKIYMAKDNVMVHSYSIALFARGGNDV